MFCLCVCNAVHLCVFTFYGVFHIFCTSVYLLVLPVFFYLCYPVGFTCVFFNSVHLLVLSVFLYFCHLCVSTIMVYVFTCGGVDPEVVLFLVVPQFLDAGDGIL